MPTERSERKRMPRTHEPYKHRKKTVQTGKDAPQTTAKPRRQAARENLGIGFS